MPRQTKVYKSKRQDGYSEDEKSAILKCWLELADAKKLMFGPSASTKGNKAKLLDALQAVECDKSAVLAKAPTYGTSKYNWLKTFVHRETRGNADDSHEMSQEDSVLSDSPPF